MPVTKLFYANAVALRQNQWLDMLDVEPYRTHASILIAATTKASAVEELIKRGMARSDAGALIRETRILKGHTLPTPVSLMRDVDLLPTQHSLPQVLIFSAPVDGAPLVKVEDDGGYQVLSYFRYHASVGRVFLEPLPNGAPGGRIYWRHSRGFVGSIEIFRIDNATVRGDTSLRLSTTIPGFITLGEVKPDREGAQERAEELLKELVHRLGGILPGD